MHWSWSWSGSTWYTRMALAPSSFISLASSLHCLSFTRGSSGDNWYATPDFQHQYTLHEKPVHNCVQPFTNHCLPSSVKYFEPTAEILGIACAVLQNIANAAARTCNFRVRIMLKSDDSSAVLATTSTKLEFMQRTAFDWICGIFHFASAVGRCWTGTQHNGIFISMHIWKTISIVCQRKKKLFQPDALICGVEHFPQAYAPLTTWFSHPWRLQTKPEDDGSMMPALISRESEASRRAKDKFCAALFLIKFELPMVKMQHASSDNPCYQTTRQELLDCCVM